LRLVTVLAALIENPRHDLVIGLVAAALMGFSLVAALVVPRRYPDFPGRHMRLFALVAVLLVGGMLASVEALGESKHFGGVKEAGTGLTATPTGVTTTSQTTSQSTGTQAPSTSAAGGAAGNPANGKALFAANGCGACHTFAPAGATAQVGPDLGKLPQYARQAKTPLTKFVMTSIVDPNAYVQPGFPKNTMPTNFGSKLSDAQVADLVAFLVSR
jgi:cytochrome c551/c552